jgi:hypothetical protein
VVWLVQMFKGCARLCHQEPPALREEPRISRLLVRVAITVSQTCNRRRSTTSPVHGPRKPLPTTNLLPAVVAEGSNQTSWAFLRGMHRQLQGLAKRSIVQRTLAWMSRNGGLAYIAIVRLFSNGLQTPKIHPKPDHLE